MITRLDGASARMLSAGQVINDLCSVVKELVENSLDAGAQTVTLRIERYGLDSIIVEDDGSGLALPHVVDVSTGELLPSVEVPLLKGRATTKMPNSRGAPSQSVLSSSVMGGDGVLGFRGEALHSLAHMSDTTVETMHASTSPYTVTIRYDRAQHTTHLRAGVHRQGVGTLVAVKDLFAALPVRRKEFEKNKRKQLLRATAMLKQYAISHPELRLLVTHQDGVAAAPVTLLSLSGSKDLHRSLTEAYGGVCVTNLTEVTWLCTFGEVHGYVSKPGSSGRLGSDCQVFAMNRRLVDLPRFAKSINDAFVQCLPNAAQRQSVMFFLQLQMNESIDFDVNLAPNKRKVMVEKEDMMAEEVRQHALTEFGKSSEQLELERTAREKSAFVDVRAAAAAPGRTPTTSFTDYTFKRSRDDGGVVAPLPVVRLDSLVGAALYKDEGEDTNSGEDDLSVSPVTTLPSCPSSCSSDGSADACLDESRDAPAAASLCECVGGEGSGMQESSQDTVLLSDEGNRRRDDGPCCNCVFPPLSELATQPLRVASSLATSSSAPVASFSAFAQQSDGELTAYFSKSTFKDLCIVGQFNHGFIIAYLGNDLFVIDQHASDEKYNYERLMTNYTAKPQPLVIPVVVSMQTHEVDLALEHAEELLHHGFKVLRGVDPTKLQVCSLPVLPYDVVSAPDVVELVQQLVDYGRIHTGLRAVWHSMATKACRSSIMIGTPLSMKTMRTIVDHLSELEQPWNCPHGRPTLRHLGELSSWQKNMTSPKFP